MTSAKLAKAWNIDIETVDKVLVSNNHKHFQEIPDEDVTLLLKRLLGGKKT